MNLCEINERTPLPFYLVALAEKPGLLNNARPLDEMGNLVAVQKRILNHTSRNEVDKGCWIWIGSTCKEWGYGRIKVCRRVEQAHRISYRAFNGPIPPGLSVLHRCDTPACCNPEHLFLGTHKINMEDMKAKRLLHLIP